MGPVVAKGQLELELMWDFRVGLGKSREIGWGRNQRLIGNVKC